MIFRFKLDGNIVEDPLNWEGFKTGYERIADSRGAFVARPEGELIFHQAGAARLYNAYNAYGTCGRVELDIDYKNWDDDAWKAVCPTLIIRMVDCEFDFDNSSGLIQYAKVAEVRDNDYLTRINANGDIKAKISVGRSKNDEDITADVPAVQTIDFFNCVTGFYNKTDRKTYKVYDVLKFLVAFASDGGLDFESTFFGVGGEGEGWQIATGAAIRTANTTDPPFISFEEARTELFKIANVSVLVDDSVSPAVIRIEGSELSFDTQVQANQIDGQQIKGLKQRQLSFSAGSEIYNGDRPLSFFSTLKIGSETHTTGSFPDVNWKGWKDEEYHITGDCAAKETFNIVGSWIRDSNVIEAVLGGDTSYDSNIFIFETDTATGDPLQFTVVNPGATPFTYNDGLSNSAIADRFLGSVPAPIAQYLGLGTDEFYATLSTPVNSTAGDIDLMVPGSGPVPYDNETLDPGNNYNPVTYRYTAPGNGFYKFYASLNFTDIHLYPHIDPNPPLNFFAYIDIDIYARRYDAGNVLLEERMISHQIAWTGNPDLGLGYEIMPDQILEHPNSDFYLNTGDYVQIEADCRQDAGTGDPHEYTIEAGIFKTDVVYNSGGIYHTYDPNDFRGNFMQFEVPMTFEDFQTMVSYPLRYDQITIDRTAQGLDAIFGWIVSAKYPFGPGNGIAIIEIVRDGN